MCTSQLSDASSAVWTRLSGTRSRSALRSVTWTTSQPSSPGTRSMSPDEPQSGQHAMRVVVGAPTDEGQHAGHRCRAERVGAQAHRHPLELGGVIAGDQQLHLASLWRQAGEIVLHHLDARRVGRLAEACHAFG